MMQSSRMWLVQVIRRYFSCDKFVGKETPFLKKIYKGQVEDGARGLGFGSSVSADTFAQLVTEWETLVRAVQEYEELLKANDIGVESNERQRIQRSAQRVGLEVPVWFDSAENEQSGKKNV